HLWPLNPAPPPELRYLLRYAAGFRYPGLGLAVRSAIFRLLWLAGCVGLVAMLASRERSRRRWLPLAALFGLLAAWFAIDGFDLFPPPPFVCLSMSVAFLVAGWFFFQRRAPQRPFLVAFSVFAGLAGSRTAFATSLGEAYGGPAHLASSLTWVLFLCFV